MAAADCTVFAVKGQAVRVYGWIKDATTGNPIATIGTLSAVISQDGVYNASPPTPQAVTSHNGRFYIELNASQNNYYNVGITVISSTANALYATIDITNLDMSEKTGHWYGQTVKRPEDAWAAVAQYMQNRVVQSSTTEDISVYQYGSTTTVLWTNTVDTSGTNEIKAQAS